MRQLSASKVDLAVACLASFRDDSPEHVDEKTSYARFGDAAHDAIDDRLKGLDLRFEHYEKEHKLAPAQRRDLRKRYATWSEWWAHSIPHHERDAGPRSEVKIAYDPFSRTSLLLKSKKKRDYSEAPKGWFVGTADLVQRLHDDSIRVWDWKTGFRISEAKDSWQISTLSVAFSASKDFESDLVDGALIRIGNADVFKSEAKRKRVYLDIVGDELEQLAEDMAKEEEHAATPQAGPWCKANYCPVRHACGAFAQYENTLAKAG